MQHTSTPGGETAIRPTTTTEGKRVANNVLPVAALRAETR